VRITLIASAMFAVYNWVYLKFINPEFTDVYIAYSRERIVSSGLSEEVIQRQLQELSTYGDMMSSDFLQSMLMFVTVFLIGTLCSLVGAAAIRSR
jgi:hypothetical protein